MNTQRRRFEANAGLQIKGQHNNLGVFESHRLNQRLPYTLCSTFMNRQTFCTSHLQALSSRLRVQDQRDWFSTTASRVSLALQPLGSHPPSLKVFSSYALVRTLTVVLTPASTRPVKETTRNNDIVVTFITDRQLKTGWL